MDTTLMGLGALEALALASQAGLGLTSGQTFMRNSSAIGNEWFLVGRCAVGRCPNSSSLPKLPRGFQPWRQS